MNKYTRALNVFTIICLILGGMIAIIALANTGSAYNPSGALAWAAFGGSVFGFGLFALLLWLVAAAVVTGNEPEPEAKVESEVEVAKD